MTYRTGFPPISTPQSRVLVLGSMPGQKSIDAGQYYAHPRNAFWPIMAALFDSPADTLAQRETLIRHHRLALWDVMASCHRSGSLDGRIKPDSVTPNDFAGFLDAHRDISDVFLNGGTASRYFRKRVMTDLPSNIGDRLSLHDMPSTSPAYAAMSFDEKLTHWNLVKTVIDGG